MKERAGKEKKRKEYESDRRERKERGVERAIEGK